MAAARPLSRPQKGVSIEVQRRAVERVAESNGWDLTWLADEGVSGGVPPESRRRFRAALALLEASEPEALIFTKVDRASRRTEDFARLIRLFEEQDWRLIVTEMGIDTRTPMGKAMAHMAVVLRSSVQPTSAPSTPTPKLARVPEIEGLGLAKGKRKLRAVGPEAGDVDHRPSSKRKNTVLKQGVGEGTELEPGSSVPLLVAAPLGCSR